MSEALIKKVILERHLGNAKMEDSIMRLTSHGKYKGKYKGKDQSRKLQQRHKGQLVILENTNSIMAVINYAFPDYPDGFITSAQANELLDAARGKAKEFQEQYKKRYPDVFENQIRFLEEHHPQHLAGLGRTTFLVQHFGESGRQGIDVVIKAIYEAFKSMTGKDLVAEYRAEKQVRSGGKGASETPFVRGHGEVGGLSVIQTRAAITLNILAEEAGATPKDLEKLFKDAVADKVFEVTPQEETLFKEILVKYTQAGDIRGLRGDFVHIITVQDTMSNSDFSIVEKHFPCVP